MIGGPEQPRLDHHWLCVRPPATTTVEQEPPGGAWVTTHACRACGAQRREVAS